MDSADALVLIVDNTFVDVVAVADVVVGLQLVRRVAFDSHWHCTHYYYYVVRSMTIHATRPLLYNIRFSNLLSRHLITARLLFDIVHIQRTQRTFNI